MPTDTDRRVGGLAVHRLGLDEQTVRACLGTVKEKEARGERASLVEEMLQRKLITPEQAKQLERAAQKSAAAAAKTGVAAGNGASAECPAAAGEGARPSARSDSNGDDEADDRASAGELAPGKVLAGDFRLLKKLGQGGMGAVFKAHQISMDREVALKVLPKHLAENRQFVERFYREARASAKLDHPNIVRGLAVGEDQEAGLHYFAMEFIDGTSVQRLLGEGKPLKVADAVRIAIDTAAALDHAHNAGMVHRDVKPDNIMVTRRGLVKLADLGLAKSLEEETAITQTGTGFGTPAYMAPEQVRNAKYADGRADIYALGATLYHLLTAQVPFPGDTTIEILRAKEEAKFRPAQRINAEVPGRLDLILDKALAKDPGVRYQTCAELIADLESLGVAGDYLSFIDDPLPSPRSSLAPTQMGVAAGTTVALPGSSASSRGPASERSRASAPGKRPRPPAAPPPGSATIGLPSAGSDDLWHLEYSDYAGKLIRTELDTGGILKLIRKGAITPKSYARAGRQPGQLKDLKDIPEFHHYATAKLMTASASRKSSLAEQIAQIDREQTRRARRRRMKERVRRTVGWLVIVGVLAAGGYALWKYVINKDDAGRGPESAAPA